MTTRSRRSGGQAAKAATPDKPVETKPSAAKAEAPDTAEATVKAEAAEAKKAAQDDVPAGQDDNLARDGEQPGNDTDQHATDGGNAAGDEQGSGPTVGQQAAAVEDVLHIDGDPVPAEVDRAMVRDETGLSPEPFVMGSEGEAVATAPTGDDPRNGAPTAIGSDRSGAMRAADPAVPTAPTGGDARNGAPVNMAGQLDTTGELRGRDAAAKLVGSGVRGEQGVGTLDRDLPADERPTYPSTTLTRATPDAAPMEPDDVKRATEPKLGDVQTSTDPIAAAAAIQSQAGDDTVDLLDAKTGQPVKPSEFFEVPDGLAARTLMRVNRRVVEVYTIRHTKSPNQRLLFTEGQLVPVGIAQTLITLHG